LAIEVLLRRELVPRQANNTTEIIKYIFMLQVISLIFLTTVADNKKWIELIWRTVINPLFSSDILAFIVLAPDDPHPVERPPNYP
jgi:hypothetical protein